MIGVERANYHKDSFNFLHKVTYFYIIKNNNPSITLEFDARGEEKK